MTQDETSVPMNARFGSVIALAAFSALLLGVWVFQLKTESTAEAPAPETTAEVVVSTPPATLSPVASESGVSAQTDTTTTPTVPINAPVEAKTASTESAATITEPAKLEELELNVYNQIDKSWQTLPTFTKDLVYRLKVSSQGKILSYETVNQEASDYLKETPLESLVTPADSSQTKFAEFKVVLSPAGTLSVEPW